MKKISHSEKYLIFYGQKKSVKKDQIINIRGIIADYEEAHGEVDAYELEEEEDLLEELFNNDN